MSQASQCAPRHRGFSQSFPQASRAPDCAAVLRWPALVSNEARISALFDRSFIAQDAAGAAESAIEKARQAQLEYLLRPNGSAIACGIESVIDYKSPDYVSVFRQLSYVLLRQAARGSVNKPIQVELQPVFKPDTFARPRHLISFDCFQAD